jgi:hypothetical protein
MDERQFEAVFAQFLNGYWGAFHELIEAESVKPERLANSLLQAVVDQHAAFAASCPAFARQSVDALDRFWQQVLDHRVRVPDAPLTAEQLRLAHRELAAIYDVLMGLGRRFPEARGRVLARAVHGTPAAPLRADAAV